MGVIARKLNATLRAVRAEKIINIEDWHAARERAVEDAKDT
jgi:hypothetical protein